MGVGFGGPPAFSCSLCWPVWIGGELFACRRSFPELGAFRLLCGKSGESRLAGVRFSPARPVGRCEALLKPEIFTSLPRLPNGSLVSVTSIGFAGYDTSPVPGRPLRRWEDP